MKKALLFVLFLVAFAPLYGQEAKKVTSDSLLVRIDNVLSSIESKYSKSVGRYKVYPTTNVYTSLKLDTATGKIWALQIGLGTDSDTVQYEIVDALFYYETTVGRFELYPTNNNRNFILLDTIDGWAYQVQWSTKKEECGRWIMY